MSRTIQQRPGATLKPHDESGHLRLISPELAGLLAAGAVVAIMSVIIGVFHLRATRQLEESLHNTLRRAAIAAAQTVDPVAHQSLNDPSQIHSPVYARECIRLQRTKSELEGPEKLRFIYTCIMRDGRVLFVLDPTPAGDADGDGVDDKAYLMEPYENPPEGLVATLQGAGVQVMKSPYTDRWGTFISAYAPVYDDGGLLIAAAGVDMDLTHYRASMVKVWHDGLLAAGFGLFLAGCAGVAAALYERRLIQSVQRLNHAMDRAVAGERAKDRFLATISHEFRTPMNAIVGSAELLRGTRLDGFQAEQTGRILRSSSDMIALLDDVLDYSRDEIKDLKPLPVNLRDLCGEIVELFRDAAHQKGLDLGMDLDPGLPSQWRAHRQHLKRVLFHLVSNAVKFTDQGTVRLAVAVVESAHGVNALRFSVSDTGIGIKQEEWHKLFQPFVQVDASASRRHEGAGLGLAICERLCRELGAVIRFDSVPGKGSCFSFVLGGEAVPACEKHAILITSDRLQRGMLVRLLEKRGWQVRAADDLRGASGLALGDCVLFDLAGVRDDAAAEYAREVIRALPAAVHVAIDSGLDDAGLSAVLGTGVLRVISRNPLVSDFDGLDAVCSG